MKFRAISWLLLFVSAQALASATTSRQLDTMYATGGSLLPVPSSAIWPVSNGGIGQSSLTAHDVLVGNGTSGVTQVSPSTAGFVLTSNGTGSDPSFQAAPGGTWAQELVGTCDGSTTGFTLANTPSSNAVVSLYLDGGVQSQGAGNDYTISGSSITLATACGTGQKLYAIYTH